MKELVKYVILIFDSLVFRSFLAFVFLSGILSIAYAQNEVQFTFGGTQDDIGRMALPTADNGFLILGTTYSYGQGNQDILLTRTDSIGNVFWSKTYGTNDRDVAYTIRNDYGGGYIIICWVRTAMPSDDDWYILKIDDNGNVLQEQFIGGSPDDEIMNFELTSDGGYIFCGSTRSFGLDGVDSWIVKTDVNLNIQWNKTYTTGDSEHSRRILETSTGDYIYIGNRHTPGMSDRNFLIMYLNSVGDTIWAKEAGDTPYDDGRDAAIAADGNFLMLGSTESFGAGARDILLFKISPAGNLLWAKTYGGTANDEAFSMAPGLDGNYMIVGKTTSFGNGGTDLIFLNVDDDGNLIRANTVGGSFDEGYPYVKETPDLGYVVTSGTSSYGNGMQDVLTIKTDNLGNSCCTQAIPSLIVQNINFPIATTSVNSTSGMNLPTHTIISQAVNPPSDLLCYEGIEIYGEDTVCSSGGPYRYFLSPNFDFEFQWSIPANASITSSLGDTVIFVQFGAQSGYIYVSHPDGCDTDPFDSIYIQVYNDALADAGSDETICQGLLWDFNNSNVLPTASLYDSLLWSGGLGSFSNPKILRPVYYPNPSELSVITLHLTVYGSNSCGDAIDNMLLTIGGKPEVELGNDTTICQGDFFTLDAGSQYASYRWQDGTDQPTYIVETTGEYWVEVEDDYGCDNADTIFVDIIEIPILHIGNDTSTCGEFSILLDAGEQFDQYLWQDGSMDYQLMATHYGFYWVEAFKNGCEVSDSVMISEDCPSQIWFPNVFTPNTDGKNDRFLPVYENIISYQIYIYNRWGQLIYESKDIDEGWDGKLKGKNCSNGVYFFIAHYFDAYNESDREASGSITLLR